MVLALKEKLLLIIDKIGSGGAERSLTSPLPLLDNNRYDVDLIIFARSDMYEKFVPSHVNILTHNYYGTSIRDRVWIILHQLYFFNQFRKCPERQSLSVYSLSNNTALKNQAAVIESRFRLELTNNNTRSRFLNRRDWNRPSIEQWLQTYNVTVGRMAIPKTIL